MAAKVAVCRVQVGVDRPRLHIVNGDAARAEIARQAFDQPDQGGLAHGVHGAARKGHALGVATANRDDPPARRHVLDGGLRGDEHSAHDSPPRCDQNPRGDSRQWAPSRRCPRC